MRSQNNIQIRYCCICYNDLILVSHQTETENYTPLVYSVLRSLDNRGTVKLSFPADSFQVHVLMENEIAYMCVTYKTNKYYIPFKFLETMKQKFNDIPDIAKKVSIANQDEFDMHFSPVMASLLYEFNVEGDKITKLQAQVEDVKQVMLENINKVIERGERMDVLLSKTEDLEAHGNTFRQQTQEVKYRMKCKNIKMWLLIGALLTTVLTIAILLACGVIKL